MRSQARIFCDIWDDPDFLALPIDAQRLYLFLLSQRDLNHAGLVPMRLRRWAHKYENGTIGQVSKALRKLADTHFILYDRDTEEVLIRTFVRNDGVYKQPKVMLRMREDARLMASPILRATFAEELQHLPLDELSDQPGGPNGDLTPTRQVVEGVVRDLLAEFQPNTPSEGYAEGYPIPPRARAGAFHHPPSTILLPPSSGSTQVGGGGYVSSSEPQPPPPIEPWRCKDHQGIDANCFSCKAAKDEYKASEAQRKKDEIQAKHDREEARRQAALDAEQAAMEKEAAQAIIDCDKCDDTGHLPDGTECFHLTPEAEALLATIHQPHPPVIKEATA